ncbi:TetR/AcrR family transcriptional regulator [Nocardia sp. NPDC056000]|uniref:TetR/AcrR family transcriptional regulator n=1 Tax=Nocardia sp. NPDC056000 TaxID=3345674 RepID=UPI0035E059A0
MRSVRAQSQAQTREAVLDAAEELFLTQGFTRTTMAQIATRVGRTQGSIYGNFPGKEALCQAVLERHYTRTFTEMLTLGTGSDPSLEDRIEAVTTWWRKLGSDDRLTILLAEYTLAARHDAERVAGQKALLAGIRGLLQAFVADLAKVSDDNPLAEEATVGVLATGTGLAIAHATGMIDIDLSASILNSTMRQWVHRLRPP